MLELFLGATNRINDYGGQRQGQVNKSQKSRNSASPGSNKGKAPKLVIGCPACPRKGNSADDFTKVNVASGAKRAKCPAGHYFRTDGKSIPGNQNLVLNLSGVV